MRTALIALLLSIPLLAEDPAAAKDRTVWSASHKVALWLGPSAEGKCLAQLLLLQDDGTPKAVWKDTIPTPAYALVPDVANGFVTIEECDPEKSAEKKVLSIHDATGKIVAEFTAKDLLDDKELQEVMLSGKPTAPWFSQMALLPGGAERTIVIRTASGRELSIAMKDGARIALPDWVKRLGSADWSEREEASARIRAAGPAALPLLAEAVGSPDAEVRVRALSLIDDCRWGGLRIADKVLAELCSSSTVVFRGKVVSVGKSPGFWSGTIAATQEVTYQVLETYKGKVEGDTVTVSFYLVHGARLSDAQPRLNPGFFAEGTEHVVFVRAGDKGRSAWSETYGALPPVPGVIDAVKGK